VTGLLLLASGGYLFYYWARLRFGDTATVADDPIVSFGVRFSGQALVSAACSGAKNTAPQQSTSAAGSTTGGLPGPRQLTDLRDISQPALAVQHRSGEPRLIVLVSPT
jgi:hypothetical protein